MTPIGVVPQSWRKQHRQTPQEAQVRQRGHRQAWPRKPATEPESDASQQPQYDQQAHRAGAEGWCRGELGNRSQREARHRSQGESHQQFMRMPDKRATPDSRQWPTQRQEPDPRQHQGPGCDDGHREKRAKRAQPHRMIERPKSGARAGPPNACAHQSGTSQDVLALRSSFTTSPPACRSTTGAGDNARVCVSAPGSPKAARTGP